MAIPLIALIGVSASAFSLQLEERSERQTAVAANRIVMSAAVLLQVATDAETRVRGYAATRDDGFLGDYDDDAAQMNAGVEALAAAAVTPEDDAAAEQIRETVAAHQMQLLRILTGVANGESAAQLGDQLTDGKGVMDRLRAQIDDVAAEPSATTAQKRAQVTALEDQIVRLQIIGLVIGLLAGAAGIALFSSGISRRVTATAANADRLGAGQALLPARPAADELGRLNVALADAQQLLGTRLEELSTARDQALAASHAKNSFLSRTSHELRTPLNAILGFAQLLKLSELDEDDRESVQHIHRAGRHLLALINELIDISRVESGELQVSLEPISVARIGDEVLSLVGPLADARQITVDNRITDPSVAVVADYQRLKQVLLNLVSNAIKYNRHAGSITLEHRRAADGTVELRVTDTGQGLTEDDRERIWMPFERLEADRGPIEGTGIGLPLARALTEVMHGTIEVDSVPGAGSTFSVRLPGAASVADEQADDLVDIPAASLHRPLAGRLTVLSIEDNMANSQVLDRLFRTWPDVTLLTAGTAEDGLELAGTQRPDLILLDLHLPGMSGDEAFRRLRAEPATTGIPIVVLSADATPGTVRRLLARGAAAYLTKPLDLASLRRVVEDATQNAPELPPAVLAAGPVRP